MSEPKYKIYKKNVLEDLTSLASYEFQNIAWFENNQGVSASFTWSVDDLFEDFHLREALYEDEIIVFDRKADQALRDLNEVITPINEDSYRGRELIDSPEMEKVRQKAAEALEFVKASDGAESTVEIIE